MSRFLSLLTKMPRQPEMVTMLRMPAAAFMRFQGPLSIMTPSTAVLPSAWRKYT